MNKPNTQLSYVLFFLISTTLCATTGRCYDFTVSGAEQWHSTSFSLDAGQQYSVSASGWIASDSGGTPASYHNPDSITQTGFGPYGPGSSGYIAPGLVSYSLVGRVDAGTAFQLGSSASFVAPASGFLSLAFNDDFYPDNSGSWQVNVVPEPSSLVLVGFGLLGILFLKRRTRRVLG